jgi:hypothetical protein
VSFTPGGQLDVDGDVDVLTDHKAARVEGHVEGHTKIFAVDASLSLGAAAHVPPGIFRFLRQFFHVESYLFGDAVDGQIAGDAEAVTAAGGHPLRLEANARELFDVEKIGALEVRIALLVAGADAGDLDRGFDGRGGRVRGVEVDASAHLVKLALHVGDHHVTYFELRGRVRRVNLVGAHLSFPF